MDETPPISGRDKEHTEPTHALQKFILANYPTVSMLKLPNHELCEELTREYGKDAVKYTLDNMENYTGLERKYKDAGVTLRTWLTREYS